LLRNPDMANEIERKILIKLGVGPEGIAAKAAEKAAALEAAKIADDAAAVAAAAAAVDGVEPLPVKLTARKSA